jgi:hypothetical protein
MEKRESRTIAEIHHGTAAIALSGESLLNRRDDGKDWNIPRSREGPEERKGFKEKR